MATFWVIVAIATLFCFSTPTAPHYSAPSSHHVALTNCTIRIGTSTITAPPGSATAANSPLLLLLAAPLPPQQQWQQRLPAI